MGYIYRNRNWLTKISLLAFSLFFTLSLAQTSDAQAGKIKGSFGVSSVTSSIVVIGGQITNTAEELKASALKVRLGQKGAWLGESNLLKLETDGNFVVTVENLQPDTVYDYQVFDSAGTLAPLTVTSFKTSAVPMLSITTEVQPSTFSAHIVGWIVTPDVPTLDPKLAPLKFVIEYGELKPDGKNDFAFKTDILDIAQDGTFEISLFGGGTTAATFGLKPSTVYQFRIADTNTDPKKRFNPTPTKEFKTNGENVLDVGAQIGLVDATSVKVSGLVLNKNPQNLRLAIRYGLTEFEKSVSIPSIDLAGNFFDVPITGLTSGALYRFQIYDTEGILEPAREITFNIISGARSDAPSGGNSNNGIIVGGFGGNTPGTPSTPSGNLIGLPNPLGTTTTLAGFVKQILDIVMMIGVPIVAIFIIYSGFLFVKARGNETELKTAKATFLWTVVGAAILLASWILAMAICETVRELGQTTTQCQ